MSATDEGRERAAHALYEAIYAHLGWTWEYHASTQEQAKVRGWIDAITPVLAPPKPRAGDGGLIIHSPDGTVKTVWYRAGAPLDETEAADGAEVEHDDPECGIYGIRGDHHRGADIALGGGTTFGPGDRTGA